MNEYTPKETIVRKDQYKSLSKYLDSMGVSTVVLEDKYVSRDYLHDYSMYYALCFAPYNKFCRRVHFFSQSFDQADFEQAVLAKGKTHQEIWKGYLGHIVVKPIPTTILGFTLLKPHPDKLDQAHNGSSIIFDGIRKYNVHLFGHLVRIKSLAFQEQDSVVSACATTAIWSMLSKAAKDHYAVLKSPSRITQDADVISSDGSRLFPNKGGLAIDQLGKSIHESGLEVELFPPKLYPIEQEQEEVDGERLEEVDTELLKMIYEKFSTSDEGEEISSQFEEQTVEVVPSLFVKRILRAYSRLGIPPILIIMVMTGEGPGLHAITVSGYRIGKRETKEHEYGISFLAERISAMYAHDDQFGPFESVTFKNEYQLNTQWNDCYDGEGNGETLVYQVVVPTYPKVRIDYRDINDITIALDAVLTSHWHEAGLNHEIVWDEQLMLSEDFKSDLKSNSVLTASEKLELLERSMPKYIWVTSCYVGEKIFDFVFDATDVNTGKIILNVVSYCEDEVQIGIAEYLKNNKSTFLDLFDSRASISLYSFLLEKLTTTES